MITERLPGWFKVRIEAGPHYRRIQSLVREKGLHTICEEARCPNKWECWNNRTATFLLLGDVCTRRCHYCSVTTGRPDRLIGRNRNGWLKPFEPWTYGMRC